MFGKFQETLATESWKGQRLSEEMSGGFKKITKQLTRAWTCVDFGCVLCFKIQILITFQYDSETKDQCTAPFHCFH